MKITIIGANGMLSVALTKYYYGRPGTHVTVYGLEAPRGYVCDEFHEINLIKQKLDYIRLAESDVIIYASGAGVQASLDTASPLMYALNLTVPIDITLNLKEVGYKGIFVSFGSYLEIGANDVEGKAFTEEEVVFSSLAVSNDYALSKRVFSRYVWSLKAAYTTYHFILPNLFSEEDLKPGTRLVPYTLHYLQDYCSGRKPADPQYSAGTQIRQFITMDEMIQAIDKAILTHIPSGIYNVGGGECLSVRQLIERLFAIYNVPCKNEYFGRMEGRDSDIKFLRINGAKLFSVIGYMPDKSIEDIFNTR